MTLFLDACVLFPPLVRTLLLGAASRGAFRPLWSARVLEEWRLAVARQHGMEGEAAVGTARADMATAFPGAEVAANPDLEAQIALPDPDDAHVVAAAAGQAEAIVTFNLRDFPARALAAHSLQARHPDGLLWELLSTDPDRVAPAVEDALRTFGLTPETCRGALRRARLSRFAKAWAARQA